MRKGGLASWSIYHPVSTIMLTLTALVLGAFALGRLSTDLLPQLIYPQIAIRIIDPGVSATIMEDRITRQLEEQLAIVEDAIGVDTTTTEGNSRLNLHFEYGKDIDIALRDASTRLDRARRFLPTTIDPPVIFKYDPSQIPVLEFVVSSSLRDPVTLRSWADYDFSRRFINLPGVAAVEIGGGLEREIHVLPDQRRLAGLGLSIDSVINSVREGNRDEPSGRLLMSRQEFGSRTAGRLSSIEAIAALPVPIGTGQSVPLSEVAQVIDTHEEERLRVRFDGNPGIKMSIQKQPEANTIDVANLVKSRMGWMKANGLIPEDIEINTVSDQSVYVDRALNNAIMAALSGAILAMTVVYLFLGNIRGTLIIGSAIPISIMLTFVLMSVGGLTFNIMTLGGLALGVGMLIDNTIVMLENIARHKKDQTQEDDDVATIKHADEERARAVSTEAASEVNSAIVAATTTNLAAVLPFLFVSGLVGLLFKELIFTISAAIAGSLVVALTLVPSLAARMRSYEGGALYQRVDGVVDKARNFYSGFIETCLHYPWKIIIGSIVALLVVVLFIFNPNKQDFLPSMDDGKIRISATLDTGIAFEEMDQRIKELEILVRKQGDVEGIFTLAGGSIFGRSERYISNRSTLYVQLVPLAQRDTSSQQWVKNFQQSVAKAQLAGMRLRTFVSGVRGLRTSGRGEDDVSIRVEGPDLEKLSQIGDALVNRIDGLKGVRNVRHSAEDRLQEFAINIDRNRAVELNIDIADVARAMRIALEGLVVSEYLDGDRSYNIRVRLPRTEINSPDAVGNILLFGESRDRPAIYLRDIAKAELVPVAATIKRENQVRIVEVSASVTRELPLGEITRQIKQRTRDFTLPAGYSLYLSGSDETLRKGKNMAYMLLALALFLVFVVMAVQYESLKNPAIILVCAPFSLLGVFLGLSITSLELSMPVWLGVIMLVGIVVNNAIVLVEYIELSRKKGSSIVAAIIEAGRLRLRPILMTTLTTVVGMLPLAIGLGEGSEMLQPLAITIVSGLSFSVLVTLVLVPITYLLVHGRDTEHPEVMKLSTVA
jgi:CzcA family heavy metal efflux pump